MDRHARLSALLDLLGERGKVSVEEIATELEASAATVRRDLDHLAEQQLLTRTRGGAVAQNIAYDLPLRYKAARNAREKERIARAAAAMVAPGAVVGVNGGTTTTEIARSLVARADLGDSGTSLTIVTNALNIANELVVRPQVKTVVTGGVARPQSFELTGPLGTHLLQEITLDIVFLGVDAVDPTRGAFAHNEGEANINRLMTERADQVVVVADSSKLGRTAFAHICPTASIDMLLTDSTAPGELVDRFTTEGVPVKAV
ncbi:DeoR/GlpR family DNA-binding transcription regulator [Saccharopolyspora sp. WRP15-2]|uniref:DeoR/GlpR family DNA-binding transcription regulator n=1 Tax=Saccharopolyspora oryzae TaxID=2997343 RepID=A0ABT4V824_9PSEU|nr:DeoR/GlpR family DNA-binding transcription regulator [Saccharopolyspora oryzae]MDA3630100.1 DeoR/GlpR family DNA-binding transcription regulator [Saccharopolyspora oryzae]